MTFGQKLRLLRATKGWTKEELALKMHKLSYQSVNGWESDNITPSLRRVGELCRLFGLKPDEFFKGVKL